jgi:uncharacterized membrane protein YhiD involved in acid resistance
MQPSLFPIELSPMIGSDLTLGSVLLSLLTAFVLGQAVAWVYIWTHSGLSYSRSFTQALVLISMVVTVVMSVVGNSIVTAFGLLGALALIRFRNVLKDTRDTVFIFISLVIGMAVGTQRYMIAVVGTVGLTLAVLYLERISFGSTGRYDGYLTLRMGSSGTGASDSSRLLHRFCRAVKQISSRQTADEDMAEYIYQVGLRDRRRGQELLEELRRVPGVAHASLLVRNELSEV